MGLDKDCELHKTVVFDDYLVADINARNAFFAGGLIGVHVLVLTLFYEGVFDVFYRLVGLIPFAIVLVGDLTLSLKLKGITVSQKYAKIIIRSTVKRSLKVKRTKAELKS